MKRILLVFGTRPEAVKMCPLVQELQRRGTVQPVVCVTGQHRKLLWDVLNTFHIKADYDLALMEQDQPLDALTAACLAALGPVFDREQPNLALVHGDTTTALAAAMAAFYHHIPVGHVEAGLRTGDISAPFPEEFNRRTVDMLSQYAFAPTEAARNTLLSEGFDRDRIWVTGNTGIDALRYTLCQECHDPLLDWLTEGISVVLTLHRRENLGRPMEEILSAVRALAADVPSLRVLCPVHPNPQVQKTVYTVLGGQENIRLTEPMGLVVFHNALARARLILTDSGGVQEEAAALGVPALVLREKTERPEGVEAGGLLLIGTERMAVYEQCLRLLADDDACQAMRNCPNPYGDGYAVLRIADVLERI